MLGENTVDADLRLFPLFEHIIEKCDNSFDKVEALYSGAVIICCCPNQNILAFLRIAESFGVHRNCDLVYPWKLVEYGHKSVEEALHSIAILFTNFSH